MITNKIAWASGLVWAFVTWAAWAAYVPDTLAASTVLVAGAGVALLTGIIAAMAINARPTRSIAHVLHDAEEASRPRS